MISVKFQLCPSSLLKANMKNDTKLVYNVSHMRRICSLLPPVPAMPENGTENCRQINHMTTGANVIEALINFI